MAMVPQTERLAYTDATVRFPPTVATEQLAQFAPGRTDETFRPVPDAAPYAVAVLFCIAIGVILGACYVVAMVDSQAFALLAAAVVAGFLWIAFGATR